MPTRPPPTLVSSPQPNCPFSSPSRFRIALAHSLGFTDYPTNSIAAPYLNYIENRRRGLGTLDDYLDLFRRVVQHFQEPAQIPRQQNTSSLSPTLQTAFASQTQSVYPPNIRTFISTLSLSATEPLFASAPLASTLRDEFVADTVMYMLGVWTMMLGCFVQLPGGHREVEIAYCIKHGMTEPSLALEETPEGLLRGSGLLPSKEDGRRILSGGNGNDGVGDALKGLLAALVSSTSAGLHNDPADQKLRSAMASYVASSTRSTHANIPHFPPFAKGPFAYSTSALDMYSSLDALEAASVNSSTLNACTLSSLAGVRIHWTANLSRHLLLSNRVTGPVLEVFALPCIFRGASKPLQASGLPADLIHEIQESYSLLFNTARPAPFHTWIFNVTALRRWCWCRSCSARRFRDNEMKRLKRGPLWAKGGGSDAKSEFDPHLATLIKKPAEVDWTYDLFPNLWSRILALEEHLHTTKPWNFWVLFRDRRDTLQFWTFLSVISSLVSCLYLFLHIL